MPSRDGEDASDTGVPVQFGSPEQKELTSPISISGDSDASKARVTRSSARLRGANRVDVDSPPVKKGDALDSGKRKVTPKQSAVPSVDSEHLDASLNDGGTNSNSSRMSSRQTRQSTASQDKGGKKKPFARKRAKANTEGESPSSGTSHVQSNNNNEIDDVNDADQEEEITEVNGESVGDSSPIAQSKGVSSPGNGDTQHNTINDNDKIEAYGVENGAANASAVISHGDLCSQVSDLELSPTPCDSAPVTKV
jgi:hypothetical protein